MVCLRLVPLDAEIGRACDTGTAVRTDSAAGEAFRSIIAKVVDTVEEKETKDNTPQKAVE